MTLKKCVICDGINFSKKVSVRDPLKKSTKYSLMLCLSCKTVSTTPIPKDLDQYYSVNYDSYQKKTSLFSKIYSFAQNLNNYRKTKILKQINAKSILDYGCGSGSFVRYTSKRGYETNGYEPINDTNGTNISDSMETFKNKNFDCITMWHVLEHTKDPVSILKELKRKLQKGGSLLLALPNYDSYDNIYYKKEWAGYDVPRHLYHFNHNSLENLMKEKGFTLISKHPLWLDSYYVSYLSSKYKKSIFPLINSLVIGSLSNILAIFTSKYSSSFYICLLYTSPSPRDRQKSRMPSSA